MTPVFARFELLLPATDDYVYYSIVVIAKYMYLYQIRGYV